MKEKINKISALLVVFVMMLNYATQVVSVKPKHHCASECHCSENCGCGCKGKIVLNLTHSVCLDALGCGCSKGKNISDLPIKEGLISKIEIFLPLPPLKFSICVEEPTNLITTEDIFHPPENFA